MTIGDQESSVGIGLNRERGAGEAPPIGELHEHDRHGIPICGRATAVPSSVASLGQVSLLLGSCLELGLELLDLRPGCARGVDPLLEQLGFRLAESSAPWSAWVVPDMVPIWAARLSTWPSRSSRWAASRRALGLDQKSGHHHDQEHCEQYVLHRAMLFGLLLYRDLDPRGRTGEARRGPRLNDPVIRSWG